MNEFKLGWVAGLIEGEGCFSIHTRHKNGRPHPRICVRMCDFDVIERIHKTLGAGRVNGPYRPKNPNAKECWTWTCADKANVNEILRLLHPHMGSRRQAKIEYLLDQCYNEKIGDLQ